VEGELQPIRPLGWIAVHLSLHHRFGQLGAIGPYVGHVKHVVDWAVVFLFRYQFCREFFGFVILVICKQRLHQRQDQFRLIRFDLVGRFEFLNRRFQVFLHQRDIA